MLTMSRQAADDVRFKYFCSFFHNNWKNIIDIDVCKLHALSLYIENDVTELTDFRS